MTREEEILRQAFIEAKANKLAYPMEAIKEGFIKGAQYADQHPQYFRGQTDEMMEHEATFAKDWHKEHKGVRPTYADAIAWAEKRVIERAREWLNEELRRYSPFYSIAQRGQFIDKLVDWMEE